MLRFYTYLGLLTSLRIPNIRCFYPFEIDLIRMGTPKKALITKNSGPLTDCRAVCASLHGWSFSIANVGNDLSSGGDPD